ncbi:MAG TPA: SMC-Scp complex subunit ScpB [Gammaproteobacteria bacterium]|nr:SMC-Scp complex subunit ScpB [Gammaproteobacteria bacterium]
MELTQIKHVIEAALLAAGRPLPLDKLASIFAARASELDKDTLRSALEALAVDYEDRGLELKEVASGYRIQIKSSMTDWLTPLWEERAPRYTRALLETLALIAYRQPITRAEIEDVRGVVVSTNIVRTLLERNWIRVVGHRDVPGKPAMFGTTRDFLDYFGLTKLEDLPALADIKDGFPEESPQADLIEALSSIEGGETESAEDDEPELDAAAVSAVIAQAGEPEEEDEEGLADEAEAIPADEADEDPADESDERPVDEAGADLEDDTGEDVALRRS